MFLYVSCTKMALWAQTGHNLSLSHAQMDQTKRASVLHVEWAALSQPGVKTKAALKQYSSPILSQCLPLDFLRPDVEHISKPSSSLWGLTQNLMERSLCCDAKPGCGFGTKLCYPSPSAVRITRRQKQLMQTRWHTLKQTARCSVRPMRKGSYCKVMQVHAHPLNTQSCFNSL